MSAEDIRARLAAATPGPWEALRGATADGSELVTTRTQKAAFLRLSLNDNKSPLWLVASPDVIPAATGDGPRAQANAEFIAHAPADMARLLGAVEAVTALHKPINVYDECECPDGTHPDGYEWIDCEDYSGCHNSFSHYACETCCTANDYVTEWCSDTHDHSSDTGSQCPTVTALTTALTGAGQ